MLCAVDIRFKCDVPLVGVRLVLLLDSFSLFRMKWNSQLSSLGRC
jgi:hypothetical protein